MRLALLGPLGSGKGTQGAVLARHLGVPLISIGELLRARAAGGTGVWREAAGLLDRGELLPDDLVISALHDALDTGKGRGYVLDGFPRTMAQARHREAPPIDAVVHLAVPDDVALERLARRADAGRTDDRDRAVVENRLRRFHAETEPVLDFYRRRRILTTVDATQPPAEVTAAILRALAASGPEGEGGGAAPPPSSG